MKEVVSNIKGQPVTFDSFTCKFSMELEGQRLTAGSLKGLVRKVNELTKVVWEKPTMFVPYSLSEYSGKTRTIKVMQKGRRLLELTKEGKWEAVDKEYVYEFDEKAFKRLKEIVKEYKALEDEWNKIAESLKRPFGH